jgi:hypothetical protein
MILTILLVVTAMIMVIYTKQRTVAFFDRQDVIHQAIVHGTAYAVGEQILREQQNVQLFAEEYQQMITRLAQYPNDPATRASLNTRLKQRFPNALTFTITNTQGATILSDIDSLVGELCRTEIVDYYKLAKSSAGKARNPVLIHPQSGNYHYDVMARVGGSVFFVSIFPRTVAEALRNHEIPGHQLILVKRDDQALIEIAAKGVRDVLPRDIRLSREEQNRIRTAENVKGTEWRLIDLPEEKYIRDYQRQLWKETTVMLIIVALAALLMMIFIWLSERREN